MGEVKLLNLRPTQDDSEPISALESAQALLGAVMNDPTRFREVAHVTADHFAEPTHGRIWATLAALIAAGREPDLATVADRLAGDPGVASLGGSDFVFDLWDRAGSPGLAAQYAESVVEAYTRRAGASLLTDAARALAGNQERAAAALIGELRQDLETLERGASAGDGNLVSASAASTALLDSLDHEADHGVERGAMTGLRCFDRRLRGLRPGWLVVIGGRPSMAKSGLARAAAYGCAKRNPDAAVLFFSLEMDAREVAERALSAESFIDRDGIPHAQFGGGLSAFERARLRQLRAAIPGNVLIDDRSSVGLGEVRRRVWAVRARRPVAAVFIDYLQLMSRPSASGRNEALVLGDLTRGLKTLAREAETCVVLLSQLSRAVESRDDKRPHLSDLRDSGAIEQDANAVLFPFRQFYYTERAEPKNRHSQEYRSWQDRLEEERRQMDVIAAKVRGGPIGTDRQRYFAEYDHVEDIDV